MLNEKLLEGIIRKLKNSCKKTENTSSARIALQLLGHLDLLVKYMKTDYEGYDATEHYYKDFPRVLSQLKIIISSFVILLPSHEQIIKSEYNSITSSFYSPRDFQIYRLLEHCIDLLEIGFSGEEEIEGGQVFLGIKEKLKQAGQSFRNQDYSGLFSSLHTAVELTIKDKLGIPLNIGEIKIGRVIGVCIRNRVFPGRETMLKDLNEKICQIDNKVKHFGYNPSPDEADKALLVAEQSLRVLEKDSPNLEEGVRKEISGLLI